FIVEPAGGPKAVLRVAPAATAHVFPNERLLMRREYAVQPYLIPACHCAPRTIYADFSHTIIGRDYVFQRFIEGELWGKVRNDLSDAENNAIRRQLGRIARQINEVAGDAFGFPYPDPGFPDWSSALLHFLGGMTEELVSLGDDDSDARELIRWIERHRALFDAIREPRLLHGDLWPQNVLIARGPDGPEIVGILDSERAIWGDPAFEWTYHLGTIQPAYWEGYGERKQTPAAALRARAYKGIWQVLVIMERHRFKSDAAWAWTGLKETMAALTAAE
ncbi:MAG TPA: phosphotransferase, partial [Symbiobacteriaceae bacterium]|nr:phosphotransferase [Symbiobacteriaceae bacterium]